MEKILPIILLVAMVFVMRKGGCCQSHRDSGIRSKKTGKSCCSEELHQDK